MKCEASGKCEKEATSLVRMVNGKRDHKMCEEHAQAASTVAEALGAGCGISPITVYEPPKLVALGTLGSLLKENADALALFKDIMVHGEHVVGGVLPGAVLHEVFKRVRLYIDRASGTRPAAPPPPQPQSPQGNVSAPGHELCPHFVPIKFAHCAACELAQKELAEAEAARATAETVDHVGPGLGEK